jgi:peptide chain release factor 2
LAEVSKVKTLLFLNGHYDQNNAILSLHAGTGGKDAQDFTEMLMRMYLRFTENQEWKTTILDQRDGEEVGLKSATILVEGHLAYGLLKSEHGVHRLVRLSPFNAGNTRETSFALVEVLPEIDSSSEVDLKDDELKIDVFRSSGAGGQSVNTTDSAVRITHIPTGITVSCQNERSQLQNKQTALKILTGKLVEIKEREHLESVSDIKGAHKEIAWGNQIRSYVLQPYTMVKDHRTNVETSQVDKVLDGDLMEFIEGYLIKQS